MIYIERAYDVEDCKEEKKWHLTLNKVDSQGHT